MGFKEIDHTADHALNIVGKDLRELFISAGEGMTSLMIADRACISEDIAKSVVLEAIDTESLLVEWLSELAYLAEDEMLIFKTFRIHQISSNHLDAEVIGCAVTEIEKLIKAVTYHNLNIVKTRQGFEVIITFDV
jgi:SHS2 domain-containing protein